MINDPLCKGNVSVSGKMSYQMNLLSVSEVFGKLLWNTKSLIPISGGVSRSTSWLPTANVSNSIPGVACLISSFYSPSMASAPLQNCHRFVASEIKESDYS